MNYDLCWNELFDYKINTKFEAEDKTICILSRDALSEEKLISFADIDKSFVGFDFEQKFRVIK